MSKCLVVGLGGALGAIARYWFAALIGERFPTRFPLGTLLINVSGSLDEMVDEGLIVLSDVEVIKYTHTNDSGRA